MTQNDATRATAEAMPEINRRRFLLNTATAGAALALTTPAIATQPELTVRDRAIWHMRELERLALEDGAKSAMVTVVGRFWSPEFQCKTFMIDKDGRFIDFDLEEGRSRMFAEKGGEA